MPQSPPLQSESPSFEKRASDFGPGSPGSFGTPQFQNYPVASRFDAFSRAFVPSLVSPVILALAWWAAVYCREPQVAYHRFSNFAKANPSYLGYINTVAGNVLTALVGWSFGSAVAYYLSKRLVTRSLKIDSVQAWLNIANHRPNSMTFRGLGGVIAALVVALAFGALTPGFTLILSAHDVEQNYTMSITSSHAREIDLTSPAFQSLADVALRPYNCDFWASSRNATLPSCPYSNALPLLLQSGRAAVEASPLVNIKTFARIGTLTLDGSSGGTFPFTSLQDVTNSTQNPDNSINFASDIPAKIVTSTNFTIQQTLQGSSAIVNCEWQANSPISQTEAPSSIPNNKIYTTTNSYCESKPIVQDVGDLRVAAVFCRLTGDDTRWNLYLKLFGAYAKIPDHADQSNLAVS
ncbi:hypothetical protein T439DRAFT_114943 [Meredithblackwellia eburnea MCA 4105]